MRPVSEAFVTAGSRMQLRWESPRRGDRIDLVAGLSGVTFGSKVDGEDGEIRLAAAYRRRLHEAWNLDLNGSASRYRRGATAEGGLFDTDRARTEARLGWIASPSWLLTAGVQHYWFAYPGRVFGEEAESERQGQVNLAMGAVRSVGHRGYVAGEASYRFTRSNFDPAEYEGPGILLRSRVSLPAAFHLAAFGGYAHRRYDRFFSADSLGDRTDDSWQVGATLGRTIAPRVSVFLEGSFLHQRSKAPGFEFDQSRVAVGVSVDLVGAPGAVSAPSPPPAPLVPTLASDGVQFKYRDPAALEVSVVGGWNGWRPGLDRMTGPDAKGLWRKTIPLPPGIWRYAFVVDGRWLVPPDAPRYEEDGFGGRHGIVQVPAQQGDGM